MLIEILLAGLILALSVGASMYLFSLGFRHLKGAEEILLLQSKLPQALALIKTVEDFDGEQNLGDGVILKWKITPITKAVTSGQDEQLREVKFVVSLCRALIILKLNNFEERKEFFLIKHQSLQGR